MGKLIEFILFILCCSLLIFASIYGSGTLGELWSLFD
jgi:hypothetical protein